MLLTGHCKISRFLTLQDFLILCATFVSSVTNKMEFVITSSTVKEQKAVIRFLFAKVKKLGKINSEIVEDDSKLWMFIMHLTVA